MREICQPMHLISNFDSKTLGNKIISDTRGALRDDFMKQLHEMGVNQHPAYGLSWFVKKKPVLVRYLYS